MLDENLKVLARRINDLEIELEEKKQKVSTLISEKQALQNSLSEVHKRQDKLSSEREEELNFKYDLKLKELRILKEE